MPRLTTLLKRVFCCSSGNNDYTKSSSALPPAKTASAVAYHHQHRHRDQPSEKAYPDPSYPAAYSTSPATFHAQANKIAEKPASGIRRNAANAGLYVSSYETRPDTDASFTSSTGRTYRASDATTISSYGGESETLKPVNEMSSAAPSPWKGKPNGKSYDRREELTEEDEDMWARMAM